MNKKENIRWWIIVILNYLFFGFVLYYKIYPMIIPMFIISFLLVYYKNKKVNNYKKLKK